MNNRVNYIGKYFFELLSILSYLFQIVYLSLYAWGFIVNVNKEIISSLCLFTNVCFVYIMQAGSAKCLFKKGMLSIIILMISSLPLLIVRGTISYQFLFLFFGSYLTSTIIYLWFSFLSIKIFNKGIVIQSIRMLLLAPDSKTTYLDVFYAIVSIIAIVIFFVLIRMAL